MKTINWSTVMFWQVSCAMAVWAMFVLWTYGINVNQDGKPMGRQPTIYPEDNDAELQEIVADS